MHINPISTIPTYSRPMQKNSNKYHQNTAINFKAQTRYEQEVEARAQEIIKEQNMGVWKQFWGGTEKARNQARVEIDKKNQRNEIERIKAEAINQVLKERINDSNLYMQKIEQQQRINDELLREFKDVHSQTVLVQKEALEAQKSATNSLKSQLENYQKIVKEQQVLQEKRTKEMNELITKITEAHERQDTKIVAMFEKELASLKEFYDKQMNVKAQEAEKVRNIEVLYQKMNQIKENKGFGKIAGYQDIKDLLISLVGNSIVLEKDGQNILVSNGILFFGPKGSGKTTFAEAFAEQLDCNLVKVENLLDSSENLKNLRKELDKGKKLFEEKGLRTILQIDEFDEFAPAGDRIVGPLKMIFDNVSKKYHCTFFLTTNYPEKIDTILMRDGRLDVKVPLSIADKKNALEVLKHYGASFADETVDFESLADLIVSQNSEAAYSNARIENIVTAFISSCKSKGKTEVMSHKDFVTSIKNIQPDITKEAMNLFKKQIEFMKHV